MAAFVVINAKNPGLNAKGKVAVSQPRRAGRQMILVLSLAWPW